MELLESRGVGWWQEGNHRGHQGCTEGHEVWSGLRTGRVGVGAEFRVVCGVVGGVVDEAGGGAEMVVKGLY